MLVITRFRVPAAEAEGFRADVLLALELLGQRPGFEDGHVGRNVDDPDLWVLQTRWESVGTYRRALSSTEIKMRVHPLLYRALDEPSAYEVLEPGTDLNVAEPRSLR
ncbi:antibiotic biosynthesis monooxygenase family protein [Nocardioides bruguierae]|uniref:antibiotic biosynthesis monooxygenase family protein n=1 Tax=Nocardioides bruguierae TaxID=2945102 RepID=UPI00202110FB|nr:antibiotic biosynthesis monooxygenase family protein [Nocardioides bruguierae]MCL8024650.1 antibiotic biosynthesis monooxygenase [Nocardioides bruguierae]